MNAARLLCFVLLISSQACQHEIVSSVEGKDARCEELLGQMIIAEREFVVALDSVRDLETAKAAADKIRKSASGFDAVATEFARLGPLSPPLKARLLEKMDIEDRYESKMPRETTRVLTPEEAEVISPAADMYFEQWGALTMKSGLYYTSKEHLKAGAQSLQRTAGGRCD
jgi:hypothetical protein